MVRKWFVATAWFFGFVIFLIAANTLLGYWTHASLPGSWGAETAMSLSSAVGLTLTGIAVMMLARLEMVGVRFDHCLGLNQSTESASSP